MTKDFDYEKLRVAMLTGAEKYLKQPKTFWQGIEGINRAKSFKKLCLQLSGPKKEKTLLLFLTLANSTSNILIRSVAEEIISGMYTQTHSKNHCRISDTLKTSIFPVTFLNNSVNNINNHRDGFVVQHSTEIITTYCKLRGLKHIANQIISTLSSEVQEKLKRCMQKTNQLLKKNSSNISLDALTILQQLQETDKTNSIELSIL
jgi:hypothetical protein